MPLTAACSGTTFRVLGRVPAVANPLLGLEDTNLRLAVLDDLMATGALPVFDIDAFDKNRDDDDEYRDDVVDALFELPVTAEQCAALLSVGWDPTCDIIPMIWAYWGGETDAFHIRSLDGIAAVLPALESLQISLCELSDLSPLVGCVGLRELSLDGGYEPTDLSPLAHLGSLRTLALAHLDVRSLQPLVELPIEHLVLDSNATVPRDAGRDDRRTAQDTPVDLAPLKHITTLRSLSCRRDVWVAGSEPPILAAFDNAHVIETLRGRGVTVELR
jgi:hypothetical protein